MKKILALTVAIVAMAGSALAADSNTLSVTASVSGTCKFVSPTSTLAFGALDPALATDATATTTTGFWCTKGITTDLITAGQGANFSTKNRMKGPGATDFIPYSLVLVKDANANTGPVTPRTLTINGSVLNADYKNATLGAYSDTVTLNITP